MSENRKARWFFPPLSSIVNKDKPWKPALRVQLEEAGVGVSFRVS